MLADKKYLIEYVNDVSRDFPDLVFSVEKGPCESFWVSVYPQFSWQVVTDKTCNELLSILGPLNNVFLYVGRTHDPESVIYQVKDGITLFHKVGTASDFRKKPLGSERSDSWTAEKNEDDGHDLHSPDNLTTQAVDEVNKAISLVTDLIGKLSSDVAIQHGDASPENAAKDVRWDMTTETVKTKEKYATRREQGIAEGWLIKLVDGTYRADLHHPYFKSKG